MPRPINTEPPTESWRGVFAILCTPFEEDGSLDLPSLEREIDFCLAAGAHGLVTTVNASEFWTLSDEEHHAISATTLKRAGGTIPVVIGVTAGSAAVTCELVRRAQHEGADAVIAMPPTGKTLGEDLCYRFYEQVSTTLQIPLFIQNHEAPLGTRMSPRFVSTLVRDLPYLQWIKEETLPPGHAISEELTTCGPKLRGIMGGLAGRYLFDEYARGSCGTMPACESTDIHVRIWELLENGRVPEARRLFGRLLPLLNYEALSSGVYKAVLRDRGIISSDYCRSTLGNPLDAHDRRELSAILSSLLDVYEIAPPGTPASTMRHAT